MFFCKYLLVLSICLIVNTAHSQKPVSSYRFSENADDMRENKNQGYLGNKTKQDSSGIYILSVTDTICIGTEILLTAYGGDYYVWTSNSPFQLISPSSVKVSPNQTTKYSCTIINSKGCSTAIEKTIYVKNCCFNYQVNQGASGPENCVFTITQDTFPITGNITTLNKINLNETYDEEFIVNFGVKDSNGADGICFIFHQQQINYPSGDYHWLGANPYPKQLKIEFDNFQNNVHAIDLCDPSFDHIAIMKDGSANHCSTSQLFGPVRTSLLSENVEDGLDHVVRIRWNPHHDSLQIYFDGQFRLGVVYDMVNNIFEAIPMVYFTVSGSTGGLSNHQTVSSELFMPKCTSTEIFKEICEGDHYVLPSGKIVNTTGVYTDTLLSTKGCDSIFHIHLEVKKKKDTVLTATICDGESMTVGGQTFSENGQYTVVFNSINGCDSIIDLTLIVNESHENIERRSICEGDTIFWNQLEIVSDGLYEKSFLNEFGCDSVEQIQVFFSDSCRNEDHCYVVFPNVFTPNKDGLNDFFRPIYNCEIQSFTLEIYNRWGILVFKTLDIHETWDGYTFNEIIQDNYVFHSVYSINGHQMTKSGIVLVVQ